MLSQRAQALKASPTLAIAARAKELAAQGHAVISLSVGEPDWDTFMPIKQAAIAAIESGQTKYSAANGIPQLRQAIANKTAAEIGISYSADQVTVSTGAKFILFAALQVLCDREDEVLIPAPYWVSYPTMAELADAQPVIIPADASTGFVPSASSLAKAFSARTKVFLFNSPSNPSGVVWSQQQLIALAEQLRQYPRVVVISDDIYNRLVFGERPIALHLLQVAPDLKERVLIVNGASKTLSMTGWRLGWALGPKPVIQAMTNYQSQSVSCASPFTQLAALEGLQKCDEDVRQAVVKLKARRDFFVAGLRKINGLKPLNPEGAFYVWLDVKPWLGRRWQNQQIHTSRDLADILLEAKKLATVPGIESGLEGYLRLSFALAEDSLTEALQRLMGFQEELK